MKVVINNCFGGFGLSALAVREYAKLAGFEVFGYMGERSNYGNTVRYDDSGEQFCIYWLKEDLGDNPSSEVLNNAKWFNDKDIERHDEILIKVIKKLKKKANGRCADLKIVEIPDGVDYIIEEYDGNEHIAEKHRTWS